jgi:trehalose/maltose hydrolase-like predicted phosphorylase
MPSSAAPLARFALPWGKPRRRRYRGRRPRRHTLRSTGSTGPNRQTAASRGPAGRLRLALRYFQDAVAIDLADNHTTIAGGLHMAALGGTWLTAVFGFAGLSLQNDGIALNPKLPASWRTLKFGIEWRGRRLRIGIDGAEQLFHATLEAGDPMAVFVNHRRAPQPKGMLRSQ